MTSDVTQTTSGQAPTTTRWTVTTSEQVTYTTCWALTTSDRTATTTRWAMTTCDQATTITCWAVTTSGQVPTTTRWAVTTSCQAPTTTCWAVITSGQVATTTRWVVTISGQACTTRRWPVTTTRFPEVGLEQAQVPKPRTASWAWYRVMCQRTSPITSSRARSYIYIARGGHTVLAGCSWSCPQARGTSCCGKRSAYSAAFGIRVSGRASRKGFWQGGVVLG